MDRARESSLPLSMLSERSDKLPISAGQRSNGVVLIGTAAGGGARCSLLVGSSAQNSFQCAIEIAPHLRHAVIAILAKEG